MTPERVKLRTLLVEDSADDAELVVLALSHAGHEVSWERVESAAALTEAIRHSWDIVISDYGLRGFDALGALAIVREHQPDLPFIIVSGSVGEESAVRAVRAGAQDFFLKDRLGRFPSAVDREVREARHRAERRDALARLRESEERLQAIFRQVIVGIVQTDLEGRVLLANDRFCQIAGRGTSELLELREADITHPADRLQHEAILARARAGERAFALEKRLVRPDGTIVWTANSITLTAGANGPDAALLTVVDDITDRRRVEADRERLVAQLERTVKVSEMFAGVLGHDLRNPLQTILTSATLMQRRCATAGVPDIEVNIERVQRSGHRMRRMIDQLLDFTHMRIGAGIPLHCDDVDLADVARHAIDEILVGSEGREVSVAVEGPCAGCWDRDRLAQLVSNLVANAVDHREPGTVVSVVLDGRSPDSVQLVVANRGAIPSALLPMIFEPLKTSKNSKRDRASGLGLGLFISRQIVRAHGGSIDVTSDAAQGTRFDVVFPRAVPESRASERPSVFDMLSQPIAP